MVQRINLPAIGREGAAWDDAPLDPLDDPDLYDGIMWRRAAGYAVDVLVLMFILMVVGVALILIGVLSFGLLALPMFIISPLVTLAYHSYFIGHDGATPGMRMFDVEVRTWTGGRPDYFQAFLMTVLFYVTVMFTTWLILIFALFNDRNRTVHDYLSGAVAVRRTRILATGAQAA
jgi:uncharacterized RDD family membrane protein YckC